MATIRIANIDNQLKKDLKKKAIDCDMTMEQFLIKLIEDSVKQKSI